MLFPTGAVAFEEERGRECGQKFSQLSEAGASARLDLVPLRSAFAVACSRVGEWGRFHPVVACG